MKRQRTASSNDITDRHDCRVSLGVAGLLLVIAPIANAENFNWVAGSGSWSTRTNWSPAGVPDEAGDTVTIQTNNNFPFGINLDVQLPAGLSGFTLNDPNATLRPAAGINTIRVAYGTTNLLQGNLEAAAGQVLEFGIHNSTLNVADSKTLSGPADFVASGVENVFNAMDGELAVGRTLKIRGQGGPLPLPGQVVIPDNLINRGTISLDSFFQGSATLVMLDGIGTLVNERDGTLRTSQSVGVGGPLRIIGDTFNAGTIDLTDQAAGRLEIQGDLMQDIRGVTKLELAGADVDQIDNITVSGASSLGGSLDLRFINQFVPTIGQTLPILNSAGIDGRFDLVGGLVEFLDQGIGVQVEYVNANGPGAAGSNGQIILSAHSCGDADGDGGLFVNDFDLQEILTNWNGQFDAGALPDMNGDGFIGIADLNQVLANLTEGAAPVPEPASTLIMLAVVSVATGRRWS